MAIILSISHKSVNRLIRLCDKQNESIKHIAGHPHAPRVLPTHFCWGLPILDDIWVPLRRPIGSYGTRNVIEVMESWFWERPTDCLVLKLMMSLMICLSSIFRGNPLFLGHSPGPAFSVHSVSQLLPMSCVKS